MINSFSIVENIVAHALSSELSRAPRVAIFVSTMTPKRNFRKRSCPCVESVAAERGVCVAEGRVGGLSGFVVAEDVLVVAVGRLLSA